MFLKITAIKYRIMISLISWKKIWDLEMMAISLKIGKKMQLK